MSNQVDVLVAGAGPVGLVTAIQAARVGLEVVVCDPRSGDLDKACGEGLMPTAAGYLRTLDMQLTGHPIRGITYLASDDSHRVQAGFRGEHGMGVRRTALSGALAAEAARLGVQRIETRVDGVTQDDRGIHAAGISARWLVAADGLHSGIRRGLGVDRPSTGNPRFGLRRHFAMAPWSDDVEVTWGRDAEAYVTPVGAGNVGVAILGGRGDSFDQRLQAFPILRERLRGVAGGPVLGAGPLRQSSSRRVIGRVLLVGDASGYVDALTGEGISVGLAQAEALVRCLVADRPADYERAWWRATRRARMLTLVLLTASQRPTLRRALLPAASRFPFLFAAGVNAAA
ncbi:MAG: NAD(P)/FAD-dependent oxidoreductase [Actinomycetota bacterium]|nr:NAD(P)/FAD-dependent oxidoreductase [Actinomycetota bacterium]